MKRIFLCLFALALCLALSGCIQSMYEDSDEMRAVFEANRELFCSCAIEAFEYGEATFISTYEYFLPEGVKEASGMYVHDTKSGETVSLESEQIARLFESCGVNSLGVKTEGDVRICEFSIGGGKQYYNGVYYAEPDLPLFLSNFSIPLTPDGDGFSYSVENMQYYTEKWETNFYYFVAKTA